MHIFLPFLIEEPTHLRGGKPEELRGMGFSQERLGILNHVGPCRCYEYGRREKEMQDRWISSSRKPSPFTQRVESNVDVIRAITATLAASCENEMFLSINP